MVNLAGKTLMYLKTQSKELTHLKTQSENRVLLLLGSKVWHESMENFWSKATCSKENYSIHKEFILHSAKQV